jgi:hypothetical protein
VIPKLSFIWDTGSDTSDTLGLYVENSGAGPAVIKEFDCNDNGFKCGAADNPDSLLSSVIFKKPPVLGKFQRTFFVPSNSEKVGLITTNKDNVNRPAFERLIKGQVLITIEYCSIYGDCWKECSNYDNSTCASEKSPPKSPAEDIFTLGFWSRIL